MADTISDEEFTSTLRLDLSQRYAYFLERIVETGQVWALKDTGGFVMMGDDLGESFVPVWPSERFAAAYASPGEIPEPIPLDAWIERWLPGLKRDGSGIAVFPTGECSGAVVEIDAHREDLEDELGDDM
jgi:hypothetical protein